MFLPKTSSSRDVTKRSKTKGVCKRSRSCFKQLRRGSGERGYDAALNRFDSLVGQSHMKFSRSFELNAMMLFGDLERLPRRQETIWSSTSGPVTNLVAALRAIIQFFLLMTAPPPRALTLVFKAINAFLGELKLDPLGSHSFDLEGVGVEGRGVVGGKEVALDERPPSSAMIDPRVPSSAERETPGAVLGEWDFVVFPSHSACTRFSKLAEKLLRTKVGAPGPPNRTSAPRLTRCGTAVATSLLPS
mmetsp:Transcript_3956/g.8819  ORF Transcript_3956/g.8819 Transcript_3956/m.8819 type:complete len:246 (+) Transcript_3956:478-1215(+)